MPQLAYRLVPRTGSGFHFGRQGLDLEESKESFSSDSLFAAMISVYNELYDDLDAFTAPFEAGEPPFLLSSVFPYVGDLPLFPLPQLRINLPPEPGRRKRLKNLKYVSPNILLRLLAGKAMDDEFGDDGPREALQDGAIWLSSEEVTLLPDEVQRLPAAERRDFAVWQQGTVPRVTIDRASNQSDIFRMGRTVFAATCGLWVLAKVDAGQELLELLLMELGIRGIGGERSVGYGAFSLGEPFPQVPLLPSSENMPRVMTLSRYHPRDEELAASILQGGASYAIVNVGGWLRSSVAPAQRRRRVRMIEAGSVLDNRTEIRGQLVDVRPTYDSPGGINHPVYRSGFALPVGVSAQDEEVTL